MFGPGDRIGEYELGPALGQGASSRVFRAVRPSDGLEVACKVLEADRMGEPRLEARFRRESELAASVDHPNLVGFLEFIEGSNPPALAYVMELVSGRSLRARLDLDLALEVQEAIEVGLGLARALGALHAARIIHRDLKPENVILRADGVSGPDRVKLLDYGVACRIGAGAPAPEPSAGLVGTPRYMSPEQAAGLEVDGRADLYSLGVVLFELLSGQRPHEGESLSDLIHAKLAGTPRLELGVEREILPAKLTELVDACLKRKPRDRPRDAVEVLRGLEECQNVLSAVGPVRLEDRVRTVAVGAVVHSPGGAGREIFERHPSRAPVGPAPARSPAAPAPPSPPPRWPIPRRLATFLLALLTLVVLLCWVLSR